jgi:hypothetical protein
MTSGQGGERRSSEAPCERWARPRGATPARAAAAWVALLPNKRANCVEDCKP